jgi:hypothetical protein
MTPGTGHGGGLGTSPGTRLRVVGGGEVVSEVDAQAEDVVAQRESGAGKRIEPYGSRVRGGGHTGGRVGRGASGHAKWTPSGRPAPNRAGRASLAHRAQRPPPALLPRRLTALSPRPRRLGTSGFLTLRSVKGSLGLTV